MNTKLKESKYLAGDEYTKQISQLILGSWWHQIDIKKYKSVSNWFTNISKREAVQKGYDIPSIELQYQKYKSYLISNYI